MPRNKWGTLTDGVLYLDPVPPVFKNPNAFQNFVAKLRLDDTNRVVTLTCILFILIVISTFFQLKFEQNYNERQQQLFHRAHDTVNVVSPSTTISAQTEGLSDYGQKRKAASPTSTVYTQTYIPDTEIVPETNVLSADIRMTIAFDEKVSSDDIHKLQGSISNTTARNCFVTFDDDTHVNPSSIKVDVAENMTRLKIWMQGRPILKKDLQSLRIMILFEDDVLSRGLDDRLNSSKYEIQLGFPDQDMFTPRNWEISFVADESGGVWR
eukprot:795384_1